MRTILISLMSFSLCACGTVVPLLKSQSDYQPFVEDVHSSIRCELINVAKEAVEAAAFISERTGKNVNFFNSWGVKYTLKLTVVDDTGFSPSINLIDPVTPVSGLSAGARVFTLNSGINLTAKATRIETDQSFFTVKKLSEEVPCSEANPIVPFGNDLGIQPWFLARLGLVRSRIIEALPEKQSFSYSVTFEIGRRGNITPKWAFIQRNVKDVGGIFNTGHSTSHSITVTMGPQNGSGTNLDNSADQLHFVGLLDELRDQ